MLAKSNILSQLCAVEIDLSVFEELLTYFHELFLVAKLKTHIPT